MIDTAGARGAKDAADNQPLMLDLSERWGTARLVSAWEIYAQPQGLERGAGLRNYRRRRRKSDELSNRAGGRSTAKWAVLEMSVRSRVVVPMSAEHLRLVSGRTHFQQKRRTARRHEADGYIGTEQQGDQQKAGEQVASSGM